MKAYYGDNQSLEAMLIDAFPSDTTQWNDTDKDGYGDNEFGTQGDKFPNDPARWQDSDNDGIVDSKDKCVATPQGYNVNNTGCPITLKLGKSFDSLQSDKLSKNSCQSE